MYEKYYGLKRKPFCLAPDPSFLFSSAAYKQGIAYLRYGIERGEGFVVIGGEPGTGKSFLIRCLLGEIPDDEVVVRTLVSSSLGADELVRAVLICFGIEPSENKAEQLNCLEKYLLAHANENRRVILAVDEAHNLSRSSLEELRMLSNFQLGERALLQIFLLGQPSLWDILGSPNMVQFKQRIIAAHYMQPLSLDETRLYILSRLRQVEWDNRPVFNPDVFALIHGYSEGNPRQVNRLCDRILLSGFIEERAVVDGQLVSHAIDELSEELMEKPRKVLRHHAQLAKKKQACSSPQTVGRGAGQNRSSGQAVRKRPRKQKMPNIPVSLLESKKLSSNGRVFESDTNGNVPYLRLKRIFTQLGNKPRILVGLGSVGLLSIGVLLMMLNGEHLLPLHFDVDQRSFDPKLAPKQPLETVSMTPVDALSHSTDHVESRMPISLSVSGKVQHSETLLPNVEETTSLDLEHKSIKSVKLVKPQVPVISKNTIATNNDKEQLVDAVSVVGIDADQNSNREDGGLTSRLQASNRSVTIKVAPLVSSTAPLLAPAPLSASDKKTLTAAATLPTKPPVAQSAVKKPISNKLASEHSATQSDIENVAVKEGMADDEKAFSSLISRFSFAYEMGDVEKLMDIFSQDASTPESSDRDAIIESYKKLFSFTETRWLVFRDIQWTQEGDHYIGQGRFKAGVREKGHRRQRSYNGKIEFHLENRGEKPVITYLVYAYDD